MTGVPLECPHCQATDCFEEENRSINRTDIGWIDADTGQIHFTGDTEYGDPLEVLGYRCSYCDSPVSTDYLDPTERKRVKQKEIDQTLSGIDEILALPDDD